MLDASGERGAQGEAYETESHAQDYVIDGCRVVSFADEAVDLGLERRESSECPEETDHDAHSQAVAYRDAVGKKYEEKAEQERSADIDQKRRKRKAFENSGRGRDVHELACDRSERSAGSDKGDFCNALHPKASLWKCQILRPG